MNISSETPDQGEIDRAGFTGYQLMVVVLCAMVALLDGFDTQSIGYAAPRIATEFGISPKALAPILAAGLLGLAAGNFFLGPLADKLGRKRIIVLSTLWFGGLSLLAATSTSLEQLQIYRFLTGIGLGAALPNVIALTSEYAPSRLRATAVMAMFCGFPLGSTIGGFISAPLMDAYGWRSVFVMGGIAPLAFLPVLIFLLPESVRFLAIRGAPDSKIEPVLRRLNYNSSATQFVADVQAEKAAAPRGFTVPQLFISGRAASTLLLWVTFFMSLLVYYFLVTYLPTLMVAAGLKQNLAIFSVATLNLGGVAGALVLARLLDRFSPFVVLGLTYIGSAVFVVLLANGPSNISLLFIAAALAGFCAAGGQIGSNALAAALYPTAIRATGVGWALGVGRIGAILGPIFAGVLLGMGWRPQEIIQSAAAPALVGAAAVFLLGVVRRKL